MLHALLLIIHIIFLCFNDTVFPLISTNTFFCKILHLCVE